MSNLANSLQSSLEQFVKPHAVKASFPIDRLINRLGFMTLIVQAVAMLAANFAAQAKITCALDASASSGTNSSANLAATADRTDGSRLYAESYCYARGVDQTDLPDGRVPASFISALHHYILQFYLPILFIIEAGTVYLPYYVWSQTAGECLRENIQFVVDMSKKLLADDDSEGEGHGHTDSCRHKRMQNGRPSKADLLTNEALKRRLGRWYSKSKHSGQYYLFQLARVVVLLSWVAFYTLCPGFRHSDIRYQFVCLLDRGPGSGGQSRYTCVLLQASLYEVGWSTNISILLFCLLGAARQIVYFFPCVVGCRCRQCRTKRCLRGCGKECRSHYFQRILGLVVRPKRDAETSALLLLDSAIGDSDTDEGISGRRGLCCWPTCPPLIGGGAGAGNTENDEVRLTPTAASGASGGGGRNFRSQYEELEDGFTDYFSHRLADRFFISQLCYQNSNLLEQFIPDMAGANATDEFSSLGNLASVAMKLDKRSEQLRGELTESMGAAEAKAKAAVAKRIGKRAAEVASDAAGAAAETAVQKTLAEAEAGGIGKAAKNAK